jgi:glycerol uptake facilitator-like aquaporin
MQIFLVEMIATFFFVNTFMTLKSSITGNKDLIQQAMVTSMVYFGMLIVSWSISGAYLNPAIGIVQPVFQFILDEASSDNANMTSWNLMWIFPVSSIAGGIFAGFFMLLNFRAMRS